MISFVGSITVVTGILVIITQQIVVQLAVAYTKTSCYCIGQCSLVLSHILRSNHHLPKSCITVSREIKIEFASRYDSLSVKNMANNAI